MKKKIIGFLIKLIKYLLSINKKIALILSAIVSTTLSRKKIKSEFDGKDWIFKYKKYSVITETPFFNFKRIDELIDLFFYNYHLKPEDIVFNIGAENGYEIPFFCKQVGKRGKVYAVEPNPDCCRRLRKLKKLMSLTNLKIIECAVGENNKKVFLTKSDSSIVGQVTNRNISNDKLNYEIYQKTFDKLIYKYKIKKIDYTKINIEGYEINFLKGYKNSKIKVKNFCISCHDFLLPPIKTFNYIKLWLMKNNYEVNYFKKKNNKDIYKKFYLYGKISN